MAILIKAQHPNLLLKQLNEAINDGSIHTWQIDADGDYTISRMQWFQRAWLRAYVDKGKLTFGIIQSMNYPITKQLYGVYHGRFVAMLLSNFDYMMDEIEISPLMIERYDISINK